MKFRCVVLVENLSDDLSREAIERMVFDSLTQTNGFYPGRLPSGATVELLPVISHDGQPCSLCGGRHPSDQCPNTVSYHPKSASPALKAFRSFWTGGPLYVVVLVLGGLLGAFVASISLKP